MDSDMDNRMDNSEWLEQQLIDNDAASAIISPSSLQSSTLTLRSSTRRKYASNDTPKSHRGNNWDENDSILILRAYQYTEEKKKNWESKEIYNNRMFEHFQSLNPSIKNRTAKSILTRWGEMQAKYKLLFM